MPKLLYFVAILVLLAAFVRFAILAYKDYKSKKR